MGFEGFVFSSRGGSSRGGASKSFHVVFVLDDKSKTLRK